jgi:hypothetical protein
MDTKITIELLKISSEIVDICNNRDEMPNGDFQGCLEAQVLNAYNLGKQSKK